MSATIQRSPLLSTSQAAQRMHRSKAWIHHLLAVGKLPAIHTTNGYLISPDDIDAIVAARQHPVATTLVSDQR